MNKREQKKLCKKILEILSDESKWTQGVLRNPQTGGYCLLGAAACARSGTEDPYEGGFPYLQEDLATALGFKTAHALCMWNDKVGRRFSTVIKRVRKYAGLES